MYAEVALAAAVGADRQRVHEAARGRGDASERLDRLVRADHAFTRDHEQDLRAGLRAFLLLIERHPDVPRASSIRVEHVTTALAPVADELPAGAVRRLVAALSLCMGVEAALVTEVGCGLSTQESEEVKRWAAAVLLQAALDDAGSRPA